MAGIQDRDVVQERFLLRTQEPAGGYAIIMKSPSPQRWVELGRPPVADAVRAKSILSGFHVTPRPGGLRLLVMSRTEMGGSIPSWAVAIARKAGKSKSLEWARRLLNHVTQRSMAAQMSSQTEQEVLARPSATSIKPSSSTLLRKLGILEALLMLIVASLLAALASHGT
eukprot:TRINITY_DN86445_c0_g1_i1.p1 TRINITY_DN86445_c0_g1~~TRINITY_DN86445_c0_g1_i1.p1  ORF type:complete len:181 (-),score=22.74 TRINITY_DN86445_c0_g1_i1:27-533(-)